MSTEPTIDENHSASETKIDSLKIEPPKEVDFNFDAAKARFVELKIDALRELSSQRRRPFKKQKIEKSDTEIENTDESNSEISGFEKNRREIGTALYGTHHEVIVNPKNFQAKESQQEAVSKKDIEDKTKRDLLRKFWRKLGIDDKSIENNLEDKDRVGIVSIPSVD